MATLPRYPVRLRLGDARDLSFLPDRCVELVVTSPPYWDVKDYRLDGRQRKKVGTTKAAQIGGLRDLDDYLQAIAAVVQECLRVLAPNGKLCLNTPLLPLPKSRSVDHTRDIVDLDAQLQGVLLERFSPKLRLYDKVVWERTNPQKKLMFGSYPLPRNFYIQNTVEFVTIYVAAGAPRPLAQHPDVLALPPQARSGAANRIAAASQLSQRQWRALTAQVWRLPIPPQNDPGYGLHAALMPKGIPEGLVRLFTFVGDTVLDPFAGSGTTLAVAQHLGRRAIGVELEERFVPVIQAKVQGAMEQV